MKDVLFNAFKSHITATLLGLIVSIISSGMYLYSLNNYYYGNSIETFFETSIEVPPFNQGEDPFIIYRKKIKENFVGDYYVEIRRASDDVDVCEYGDSAIPYTSNKDGEILTKSLSWFLGNPKSVDINGNKDYNCFTRLKPGYYYLYVQYSLKYKNIPDHKKRLYDTASNIFEVKSSL